MSTHDPVTIGLVSTSDRAAGGIYKDEGIPALEAWLAGALLNPIRFEKRLIPDDRAVIEETLKQLVDGDGCHLVITTGGTGPAPRDVTPEATLAVADKEMPGFGEQMRRISLEFVPTAILSRQVAVIRGRSLILNLPGQPKSIRETLEGLRAEGRGRVAGIFAAVPYCIDLIGGPYLETREEVVKAFRPKSAIRPPRN
jgi:molybdopterin adenylyltransferase